ncbi:MAG: hypothetical protein JWM11_6090 [Planctomycetaceae bacterium]|nr:hypothetical protein [Planctomycetaceae bacterium]
MLRMILFAATNESISILIPAIKRLILDRARYKLVACTAMLISLWASSPAGAHPGHTHRKSSTQASKTEAPVNERIWTETSSRLQLMGSFVTAKDGQVQIRRVDDSLVSLKLSQLIPADQEWVAMRMAEIRQTNEIAKPTRTPAILVSDLNDQPEVGLFAGDKLQLLLAQADRKKPRAVAAKMPDIAMSFEAYVKKKAIRTRWDDNFFYVESNGIPDHRMMVGITAWQQQVPLPQSYVGENSWRIPLNPVPAQNPQSTRDNFLRGAIALAANGVPIFNPLNNRGDDAFLFGELDEFGGHCGRADDYHYHIAPVHLQKTVGQGLPIAYALDGYPIYGYEEPDGSKVVGLDELNGHKDKLGHYHYHATKTYPYLNGGFYGEVTERGGQVDPQPRAEPLRPDLRPLRDAKITDFVETKAGSFRLTYDVNGKKGSVSYTIAEDRSAKFVFVDTNGETTTESYTPRPRRPGGPGGPDGPRGDDRRPPPRPGENRPPRNGSRPPPPRNDERTSDNLPRNDTAKPASNLPQLVVTSSALDSKGFISAEYTCDGDSASPPVEWKNAPKGTNCYAVSLWHTAPDQEKSYWVIYNIPGKVTKLDKNAEGAGTMGLNDKRRAGYDPMCSKGPGVKKYHITIYALSGEPKISASEATRGNLLEAIKDITLAEGTLDFLYERKK